MDIVKPSSEHGARYFFSSLRKSSESRRNSNGSSSKERKKQCSSLTRYCYGSLLNELDELPAINNLPICGTLVTKTRSRRSWSLPEEESSFSTFLMTKHSTSEAETKKRCFLTSAVPKDTDPKELTYNLVKSGSKEALGHVSVSKEKPVMLERTRDSVNNNMKKGLVLTKSAPTLSSVKENLDYKNPVDTDVEDRIRNFILRPNPPRPPSTLKVPKAIGFKKKSSSADLRNRRSTTETDSGGFKLSSFSEYPVNTDTCPNATFHPNRGNWYYGAKAGKCRYLRMPDSPAPPIWTIFDYKNNSNAVVNREGEAAS